MESDQQQYIGENLWEDEEIHELTYMFTAQLIRLAWMLIYQLNQKTHSRIYELKYRVIHIQSFYIHVILSRRSVYMCRCDYGFRPV